MKYFKYCKYSHFSAFVGVIHSLILFFFPYGAYNVGNDVRNLGNLQTLGIIIAISLTIVVNLQVHSFNYFEVVILLIQSRDTRHCK